MNEICRAQGITPTAFCERIGVAKSATTAWAKGSAPRPEVARRVAMEFNRSVPEVFVQAGFATWDDFDVEGLEPVTITEPTDDQIQAWVGQRFAWYRRKVDSSGSLAVVEDDDTETQPAKAGSKDKTMVRRRPRPRD